MDILQVKNKERFNSLLFVLHIITPTIVMPVTIFFNSGIVWLAFLFLYIYLSIYVNRFSFSSLSIKMISVFIAVFTSVLLYSIMMFFSEGLIKYTYQLLVFGVSTIYFFSRVESFYFVVRYGFYIASISLFSLVLSLYLLFKGQVDYMAFGTNATLSFIFISMWLFFVDCGKKNFILWLFVIITLMLIVFLFGNRGSLLAMILVLTVHYFSSPKFSSISKFFFSILIVFLCISFIGYWREIISYAIDFCYEVGVYPGPLLKLELLIDYGFSSGSSGRGDVYDLAVQLIESMKLLPLGAGAFSSVTGITSPHNFFLDIVIVFGFFSPLIALLYYIIPLLLFFYIDDLFKKIFFVSFYVLFITKLSLSSTFWSEISFYICTAFLLKLILENYKRIPRAL